MKPVRVFAVTPALPAALEPLHSIALNLRWSWTHEAIELFRRLDRDLWEETYHNPVKLLGCISQQRLQEAARDAAFLAHMNRVSEELSSLEKGGPCWFERTYGRGGPNIAYFSAEFGLTECLSIFAGGLGMLAGDHLKSASDLGVPLAGVGLLYQQGYFRQYLNQSGWQEERYESNDFYNFPVSLCRRADGNALIISVPLAGREIFAQVWKAQVGRVPLYLLDTNIAANPRPEDRDITDQLYGGDLEMRVRQEIVLGIGGYRALDAVGRAAQVFHMNEGHSAFLALEHVRTLMVRHGLTFWQARSLATSGLIFTTHTPVEAGHDYFPSDLLHRYFAGYAGELGISWDDFVGLGRRSPADHGEPFCMTVLALRMAASGNGVSRLHGEVSRKMWAPLWPAVPQQEVPIGHVTNGVHFQSWLSREMNELYDRYLGPKWREEPADRGVWKAAEQIPGEELWRTHERRRQRLIAFARRRLQFQLKRRGAPPADIALAEEALDSDALTIGFARRFATYKRATLLLKDVDRLARILNDEKRPVQVLFAGKAHPRDAAGKEFIRQIVALANRPQFRKRLVFLEDYDIAVTRYLVQGCDVWLNNPLRPLEASGTSGMKAAANGCLNLSTLDGWWDEAWRDNAGSGVNIGWAIGHGERFDDPEYQDRVEAEALYDLLEREVVPAFYERDSNRIPRRWIAQMKSCISNLCYFFNTHRMVEEYCERFYLPAYARQCELSAHGADRARALGEWMHRVRVAWPEVAVLSVDGGLPPSVAVNTKLGLKARIRLGALSPGDVAVEAYVGPLRPDGSFDQPAALPMDAVAQCSEGVYLYEARSIECKGSGLHGLTVRVLPYHADLVQPFLPGLITWAPA
ncbi:MAG: alpha-glucan family phosphorylase [Bryobacteraceae bacterium]|nr:alpha-glucan family phosphorylase [Bryobacteraceae bacterium]